MSDPDLTYPGDFAHYRVSHTEDDYWAVFVRPTIGDIAEWQWLAAFNHETDAREYAAWQAKRS